MSTSSTLTKNPINPLPPNQYPYQYTTTSQQMYKCTQSHTIIKAWNSLYRTKPNQNAYDVWHCSLMAMIKLIDESLYSAENNYEKLELDCIY